MNRTERHRLELIAAFTRDRAQGVPLEHNLAWLENATLEEARALEGSDAHVNMAIYFAMYCDLLATLLEAGYSAAELAEAVRGRGQRAAALVASLEPLRQHPPEPGRTH